MSEPEIARRCGACGAAVRGAARFCPQCGQSMADAHDDAGPQVRASAQPALVEEAERVASTLGGRLATRAGDEAEDADARGSAASATNDADTAAQSPLTQTQTEQSSTTQETSIATNTRSSIPSSTAHPSDDAAAQPQKIRTPNEGATLGVRQRAAMAGAGVGDSLRPRVGRLRERSVVVLDEAADDPGLRFVLVAVALFVVAFLLFVFSFVLR
jgi:cobalamin biosynthesis Mg chelatase CobN